MHVGEECTADAGKALGLETRIYVSDKIANEELMREKKGPGARKEFLKRKIGALRNRLRKISEEEFITESAKHREEVESRMIDPHRDFERLGTQDSRSTRRMKRKEKKTN